MRYFDHDTEAGKNDLIVSLRLEHGSAAIDAYWTLLEYIYFYEKPFVLDENRAETKSVSHWLGIGFDVLKTYVESMIQLGLFVIVDCDSSGVCITSERAERNIARYQARAETARQNGSKGGRKPKRNRNKTQSVSKQNPGLTQSGGKGKGKGIESYSLSNSYAKGADAEKSAPLSDSEVFDWVDKNYPDEQSSFTQEAIANTLKHRQHQEELEAESVPCPPELKVYRGGGLCSTDTN